MRRIENGFVFFFYTEDPFSNWHPATFTLKGETFDCSEQYMMWAKAMLFGDTAIAARILRTRNNPQKQKLLGRAVSGFDATVWDEASFGLVLEGCVAKFEQNPRMLKNLLDTGDAVLVEASPYDPIWGVKLDMDDPKILDPKNWQGQNRLGKVLMEVRERLKGTDLSHLDPIEDLAEGLL